jgi:hypothetical protein
LHSGTGQVGATMVRCMVSFLNPGEIGLRIGYHARYYGQLTVALLGLRVVIIYCSEKGLSYPVLPNR